MLVKAKWEELWDQLLTGHLGATRELFSCSLMEAGDSGLQLYCVSMLCIFSFFLKTVAHTSCIHSLWHMEHEISV